MPAEGRTDSDVNSLRDANARNITGLSEDLVDAFYAAVLPIRRSGCSISEKW